MYRLYIIHVANNIILILSKLSIILLVDTPGLGYVICPQDHT
jgi:hypothetical protein